MSINTGSINGIVSAILTALVGVYPYFYHRDRMTRLFAVTNLILAAWNLNDLLVLLPCSYATKVFLYRSGSIQGVLLCWFFFNFILAFTKADFTQFRKIQI